MTHVFVNQSSPPEAANTPAGSGRGHGIDSPGWWLRPACWRQRAAQILNLLYRRISFGRALANPEILDPSHGLRITNPRCSRLQICATRSGRFWPFVVLVFLAEAAAIFAFYGLEWSWLRQLHVPWLQTPLQALGCQVQTAGPLLTVNGHPFEISSFCTYVDLIVCGLPFLWRLQRRWFTNLAVLATYAAAVAVVNLVRLLYGIYAYSHGVNLLWSHDVVDYVVWYATMGLVALLWMRSLGRLWSAPAKRSGDGALGCGGAAGDAPDTSESGVAFRLPPQSQTLRVLHVSAVEEKADETAVALTAIQKTENGKQKAEIEVSLPGNGRDGFHSVPNLLKLERAAVEHVPTHPFLGPI